MRVITKKRLEDFVQRHPDSRAALLFWYNEIKSNSYYSASEVTTAFRTADYVGNDRIVFNIAKNKYRLIAKFKFKPKVQIVYVRFIDTHSEYDKIKDIQNI